MEKEWILLLGALIGSVPVLLAAVINSLNQARLARVNNKHQYTLEGLRLNHAKESAAIAQRQDRLETAHRLLSRIGAENSFTASHILRDANTPIKDFNTRYMQHTQEQLVELKMIAGLYFPQIDDQILAIEGHANCFWGHQQNLLYQQQNENPSAAQHAIMEVSEASKNIGDNVQAAQYQLRQIGRSTHGARV